MLFKTIYITLFLCMSHMLTFAGRTAELLRETATARAGLTRPLLVQPAVSDGFHVGPDPLQFVN